MLGDIIKKGKAYVYKERCQAVGPLVPEKRQQRAFNIRLKNAAFWKARTLPPHRTNGDERRYGNKLASYSKAFPHNVLGEVRRSAYQQYLKTLRSGKSRQFEQLPLAGPTKLVDPQAAYAFDMTGLDSHQIAVPPPPSFSSSDMSAELIEMYWMALARDIPFDEYESSPLIAQASKELSNISGYKGPSIDGRVTPNIIFRETFEGTLAGPRISQFLLQPIPFVGTMIDQRNRTTAAGTDFLTSYDDWLDIQNGGLPSATPEFDPVPRYIRNGRDMAEWVHNDRSIDSGEIACRIILGYGDQALDPANPYYQSKTQVGFSTFGPPHILDFVTRAARPALEAAWFQKWLVHRRLRPEEYGGRIHNQLTGAARYPIHPQTLNAQALEETFKRYGTYLLPQAYAEGCPTHPSYPSGHSTFIGAMVTMLKAYFDESFMIPNPVTTSSDGLSLVPYEGTPLTLGGELNKLASNIGNARIFAGVHFRSSNGNAMQLGERIAISIMRDYQSTYNEAFKGFSLTKFDGTVITI